MVANTMLTKFTGNWGIATMLTVGMIMVIGVLMSITTILDIHRTSAIHQEELNQRSALISRTLNDVLFDSLYFSDVDQIDDITQVVINQPGVAYVKVFDPTGRLLIDSQQSGDYPVGKLGGEIGLRVVQGRETVILEKGDTVEYSSPILIDAQVIGGFQIGFDTAPMRTEIMQLTIERVWQSIVLMLAGTVITIMLAQYFVRPLRRLTSATAEISKGNFELGLQIGRRDEIGDLSRALQEMAQRLQERTAERDQAEEALREINAGLESKIQERTDELSKANDVLRQEVEERRRVETESKQYQEQFSQLQKMESVGQLAGGVAHDLNNLLTPIIGYSQLELNEFPGGTKTRARIEEIYKAADRASGLVHQLLAFSRKEIIEPKVLNANELLANLEKMLRRLIGEDVKLMTSLSPELGLIKADPNQLDQLVINLIVNARDATSLGGLISIETANVTLDEEYVSHDPDISPGRYVKIAVHDNGTGMTEDVRSHVFEPFFTTKGVGKGTGLGLSTCYGIVKQNNGSITVDSEPGVGTTFTIYLPRVDEAIALAPRPEVNWAMPQGTETILLAEDEDSVREFAAYVLRERGYTVIEAQDGAKALEQSVGGSKLDLLLSDVVMPHMGGRELADKLSELHPEIKVLFASGYPDSTILNHGVVETGTNFIQKPLTAVALATKVRQVLDGSPGFHNSANLNRSLFDS